MAGDIVTISRAGKPVNIEEENLRKGDTLLLQAGELVPADIKLTAVRLTRLGCTLCNGVVYAEKANLATTLDQALIAFGRANRTDIIAQKVLWSDKS